MQNKQASISVVCPEYATLFAKHGKVCWLLFLKCGGSGMIIFAASWSNPSKSIEFEPISGLWAKTRHQKGYSNLFYREYILWCKSSDPDPDPALTRSGSFPLNNLYITPPTPPHPPPPQRRGFNSERSDLRFEGWKPVFVKRHIVESLWLISLLICKPVW